MKNYISVNAKYFKASQIHKIYNHNQRVSNIDYLLKDNDKKYKNLTYSTNESFNLVENFSEQFNKKCQDQKAHNFFKPKTGNENEIIEMVVALSEEKALEYLNQENSEELLMQGYKQFLEDIEAKYGLKGLEVNLHTDEGYYDNDGKVKYNIHAHIIFLNYDFDKSKTVLRNLKSKDWSNMQDMAQESFQKHNLDFIRGESKQLTNKEHLDRNDFILQKQQQKLNEQILQLEKNKSILTKQVQVFNANKNKLKALRSQYDRTSNDYKELTPLFKDMQQQEKDARESKKQLEEQIKDLKQSLENQIEEARIEYNETNKQIATLNEAKEQHLNTINRQINKIDSLYEKVALNTTKNESLEQINQELQSIITKSSRQVNEDIKKSITIIKNAKKSEFDEIATNELKNLTKYNLQVKEYKELKEENQAYKKEILDLDKTRKEHISQIKKLSEENINKDAQLNLLENQNQELKKENNKNKTHIEKLVHIIKSVTGFTGNSLKSIFDRFLPKDDIIDITDIKR